MLKYKAVIFDMDGTLADTSPGIYNSHKHTLVKMGRTEPTLESLQGIIGGPLLKTYETRFQFRSEEARNAVNIYRTRYATEGIYEAKLYTGIEQLLIYLKEKGYKIGVATLKAEKFAKIMLENMGVSTYFNSIKGVDDKDTLTKSQLLQLCADEMNVEIAKCVLIGDSKYDALGAKEKGMDFIGVTYGFDFKCEKDLVDYDTVHIANSPKEVEQYL